MSLNFTGAGNAILGAHPIFRRGAAAWTELQAKGIVYIGQPPTSIMKALYAGEAWAVTWVKNYVGIPERMHAQFEVEEAAGKGWAVWDRTRDMGRMGLGSLGSRLEPSPEKIVTLRVIKGSTALVINKNSMGPAVFALVKHFGVRVRPHGTGLRWNGSLWVAGSRTRLPALKVGDHYNLHTGNPSQYITVEVL